MQPEQQLTQPFLMPIEDVFSVKGQGTAIVGPIERGILLQGQTVEIIGLQETAVKVMAENLSNSKPHCIC